MEFYIFPPDTVFIKKIDSECVSVKVLTKLLDFKIDFKNVKTREEYESDELCLYWIIHVSRGSAVVMSITTNIFFFRESVFKVNKT